MIICQIKYQTKLKKKTKTVGIVKFDDIKILIDSDDKLPDYSTLRIL